LDGGILYDVWQTLFANPDFLQLLLILALILGVYMMLTKPKGGKMRL
jgi:hypothetical protein